MTELESLFSAAAPNSDSGGKGRKSNRCSSGPKSEKVQLVISVQFLLIVFEHMGLEMTLFALSSFLN